jgi:hypothetical protein
MYRLQTTERARNKKDALKKKEIKWKPILFFIYIYLYIYIYKLKLVGERLGFLSEPGVFSYWAV